jgi:hypothetical protein
VWVDDKLSFTVHVENLIRKLKLKIGFCYRHTACFSSEGQAGAGTMYSTCQKFGHLLIQGFFFIFTIFYIAE